MRTFTIITSLYTQELTELLMPYFNKFAIDESQCSEMHIFNVGYIRSEKEFVELTGKLTELIEELLLCDNPIVKHSAKLKKTICKRIFATRSGLIFSELLQFLNENNSLNLDGYLQFYMREYSELINMLLYSVVKRNFCSIYNL